MPKQMTAEKVINGINVEELKKALDNMKEKKDIGKFKFRVHNKWIDGAHNRSIVGNFYGAEKENSHLRKFKIDADEPPLLLGKDRGANPVEHLLNALATCITTTMIFHAVARGIKIDELESDLEGEIDLRGFLGLSDEVRRGYQNISVKFKIKTDEEDIEKLKEFSKYSPVFDVTTNGTNVDVQIERK